MASSRDQPAPQYRLSSTLAGHGADVRALAAAPRPSSSAHSHSSLSPTPGAYDALHPVLFSSSRDGTARSWVRTGVAEGVRGVGGGWSEGAVFGGPEGDAAGHEGFVNAVEWMPGTDGARGGTSPFARGGRCGCFEGSGTACEVHEGLD